MYLVYFGPFGHKQTSPHRRPPNKQSARASGRRRRPKYGASSLGRVGGMRVQPGCHKQCPPTTANVQFHRVQGPPATDTKQAVWPMSSFTIVQGPPAATTEQAVPPPTIPRPGSSDPPPPDGNKQTHARHKSHTSSSPCLAPPSLTQAVLPAWPRPAPAQNKQSCVWHAGGASREFSLTRRAA